MSDFTPTLILRHRRENLKKCSLAGLETRSDFLFFTYPQDILPDLSSYVLLKVGAPPLTMRDAEKGLFLIDGTWRLADKMERSLLQKVEARSLPSHYRTAYPRRQTDCPDPEAGLSSLEALYLAYTILGRSTQGLIDHYHWKEVFLAKNRDANQTSTTSQSIT
jgi:pre-rRNA-processing protein TSR3